MANVLWGEDRDRIDLNNQALINQAKQAWAQKDVDNEYGKALYNANKEAFDNLGYTGAQFYDKDLWGKRTSNLNDLEEYRKKAYDENKYNLFGNGLFGAILNPFHQAGTAVQDLVSSGTSKWDKGERDALSDLGAGAQAALTVATMAAPFSGSVSALKGLAPLQTAMQNHKIIAPAVLGTVRGGTEGLRKYGSKIGEHLPEVASNTAMNAAFGAGVGALGVGLGKLGDIAKAHRAEATVVPSNQITYDDMGNVLGKSGISYQDALKKVGLDQYSNPSDYSAIQSILRGDALSEDLLNDPSRIASLTGKFNNMTEMLGGTPDYHATAGLIPTSSQGQNLQDLYSAIQNWGKALDVQPTAYQITTYPGLYSGKLFPKLTRAGQGIGDIAKDIYTQYGNKDAILNLLNNNYARLGAGVGAGLLTTNLLRNNNKKEGE